MVGDRTLGQLPLSSWLQGMFDLVRLSGTCVAVLADEVVSGQLLERFRQVQKKWGRSTS